MRSPRFILIFTFILFASISYAQTWQWAKALQDTGVLNQAGKLVVDKLGNSTAIGSFKGRLNFSPTVFLLSNGDFDIYVVSYNDIGQINWVKSFGSSGDDRGVGVTIDSSGSVLICGRISQTVAFGSQTLTANGGGDIFVAKLDNFGNSIWARAYGGFDSNPSFETANDVCIDSLGSIYLTGNFKGFNVDFGNGYFSSSRGSFPDFLVMKVDSNGITQWVKRGGSYNGGFDYDEGICVILSLDQQNILVGGFFHGQRFIYENDTLVNFNNSPGPSDSYYISLNAQTGVTSFIKPIIASDYTYLRGIAIDKFNNIYVTGSTNQESFISPLTNTQPLSGFGNYKVFLFKYSSNGNFIWSKGLGGGTYGHSVSEVIVNNQNEIVLVGDFFVQFECDTFQVGGSYSGFIATLDSNAVCQSLLSQNLIWGFNSVGIDKFDNLYLQGSTLDSTAFGTIPFIYNNDEIFVAKYGFNSLGTNIPNEFAKDNSFSVFPNPANYSVKINSPSEISQLELYDVFGKRVFVQNGVKSNNVEINTSSLVNGIYYLKLCSNEGAVSQQMIVVCR